MIEKSHIAVAAVAYWDHVRQQLDPEEGYDEREVLMVLQSEVPNFSVSTYSKHQNDLKFYTF